MERFELQKEGFEHLVPRFNFERSVEDESRSVSLGAYVADIFYQQYHNTTLLIPVLSSDAHSTFFELLQELGIVESDEFEEYIKDLFLIVFFVLYRSTHPEDAVAFAKDAFEVPIVQTAISNKEIFLLLPKTRIDQNFLLVSLTNISTVSDPIIKQRVEEALPKLSLRGCDIIAKMPFKKVSSKYCLVDYYKGNKNTVLNGFSVSCGRSPTLCEVKVPAFLIQKPQRPRRAGLIGDIEGLSISITRVPFNASHVVFNFSKYITYFILDRTLCMCSPGKEAENLLHLSHTPTVLTLAPTGDTIFIADEKEMILFCLNSKEVIKLKTLNDIVTCACFAPYSSQQLVVGTLCGAVALYERFETKPSRVFLGNGGPTISVDIHPNMEYIIAMFFSMEIRLYSISMGQCVRLYCLPGASPSAVRFDPDGHSFYAGAETLNVSQFDIISGQQQIIARPEGRILDFAVVPGTNLFATLDFDGFVAVWEKDSEKTEAIYVQQVDGVYPTHFHVYSDNRCHVIGRWR